MGNAQAIADAQDLVTAAKDAGETLTFEATLALVHRPASPASNLLLDVERNVPTYGEEPKDNDCSGPRPTVPVDTPEAPQALQLLPGP